MPRRSAKSQPQALRLIALIGHQVYKLPQRPPVTLLLIAAMTLLYLEPGDLQYHVPALNAACVRPAAIVQDGQYGRLFWSMLLHAGELHLLYNMSSLAWKGGQLETSIGSPAFMLLTAELMAVSQLLLVAVSWGAVQFQLLAPAYYFSHCTIGFSGVLFGYKTVATWLLPQQTGSLSGIPVPSKLVCWAELLLIQLAHPEASFLGHLCGILAGLLHVLVTRPFSACMTGRAHRVNSRQQRAWQQGQPRYATASGRAPCVEPSSTAHAAGVQVQGSQREQADLPGVPPWRMLRRWPLWLMAAGVLTAAAATNPSRDELLASMGSRLVGKQGFWTGMAASTAAWLAGTQLRAWDCCFFTLAELKGIWFLGAAGRWMVLPVGHLSPVWKALWRLAVQPLSALALPAGLQVPDWSSLGFTGLMAVHAAVSLAWLLLPASLMVQNFEAAPSSVLARPWTLVSCIFSPAGLMELLVSLQVLWALGPRVQLSIGSSGLFILYLASGGCAAVAACACRRCKRQRQLQGVRGALGSHVALAAAHMLLHGWTGWRFEAQTCGYIAAFLLPAAMTMVQQHDGSEIVAQATVGGLVGAALVQRVS